MIGRRRVLLRGEIRVWIAVEHELPNMIMTPHCSGWTAGMVRRRWDEVADNINRFVRGEKLLYVVIGPWQ